MIVFRTSTWMVYTWLCVLVSHIMHCLSRPTMICATVLCLTISSVSLTTCVMWLTMLVSFAWSILNFALCFTDIRSVISLSARRLGIRSIVVLTFPRSRSRSYNISIHCAIPWYGPRQSLKKYYHRCSRNVENKLKKLQQKFLINYFVLCRWDIAIFLCWC